MLNVVEAARRHERRVHWRARHPIGGRYCVAVTNVSLAVEADEDEQVLSRRTPRKAGCQQKHTHACRSTSVTDQGPTGCAANDVPTRRRFITPRSDKRHAEHHAGIMLEPAVFDNMIRDSQLTQSGVNLCASCKRQRQS